MAITFLEKRKRLRYLFSVLAIIILIAIIVIWRGFFVKEPEDVLPPIEKKSVKKIEIDFQTLKKPFLEELQPLEAIPSFEGEVGRENPFIPY